MKFDTKFGLGEIVCYDIKKNDEVISSEVLEIVGIYIDRDGKHSFICRYPSNGATVAFTEQQLIGDPDFDQDTGRYK